MADTLLQLVDQAAGELGLQIPTTVIGSTVAQTQQYLYLINGAGRQISREFEWNAMQIEYRFTTQYLTTTGTTTNNSAVVTGIPSTAGLTAGNWQPVGTGIQQDTYILTVDSATQVTLTQPVQATGVGVSITFSQTKYAMPAGFDRIVDNTEWDKSKHWQMIGPITQQQTEWLKSGFIATGPRVRYYIQGEKFQIWPPLGTNEYLGFNYISQYWVATGAGLTPTKSKFTLDTDTCIFPDELMVLALKLKLMEIKGFDTTAVYRDFTDQKSIAFAADNGTAILSMAPNRTTELITMNNAPDSGYGNYGNT